MHRAKRHIEYGWLQRAAWWLSVFCFLHGPGCAPNNPPQSPAPPPPPPPKPHVYIEDIPINFPVRIMLNDKQLASYDPLNWQPRYRLREDNIELEKAPDPGTIRALVETPDGWLEGATIKYSGERCRIDFRVTLQDKHFSDTEGIGDVKYIVSCAPCCLFIDNRGFGATELQLGEMRRTVPADWSGRLLCPAPKKSSSAAVHVNGKEAGALWAPAMTEPPKWEEVSYLIDVSGKRSYHWRVVEYSIFEQPLVPPKPAPQGDLRGKVLHSVPYFIDDFLQPAPGQSYGFERVEVLEVK